MADKPRSRRDPLFIGLALLVGLSLLFAAGMLARVAGRDTTTAVPPLDLTPEVGEEAPAPQEPDGPQLDISTDDLRELALALAAVITALTGLLGLVATQIWRGREEGRAEQKHIVALERERLALEKERLALEKERLVLERQRDKLRPK